MSVGQFYYKTDGFRANNDQVKSLYNIFGQAMLTPSTSVQAELRYSDFLNGDLPLRFDPNDYYPQDRYDDKTHSARLGIRHAFSPNIDLLGSFIYSRIDSEAIYPSFFYKSDASSDNYLAEVQALYRMDAFRAIAGAGYFDLSGQSLESFTGIDPYTVNYSLRHTNAYLYTLTTFPETVTWTLGLSADFFRRSYDDYDREQLNPKFGVVWNPVPDTTIRAAAFRTLKRSLPSQQTLEPTQVAGFAQFFDDDEGTDVWRYGLGIDQKIRGDLFIGAEVSYRSLEVPYQRVDPVTFQLSNDTAKWHEELAGAYIYWAPHPWLSFKAEYRYERQDRDYPMVGWENITMVKTNSFPLGINFFHPSGLLLQMKGTYVLQEADYYDVASAAYIPGSDNFWVVDAVIGYRLPKRFGVISVEGKNLLNSSFRFVDTDPAFPRIFPDRVILGKISLSF
jgi:opacity protein-like surface antigen